MLLLFPLKLRSCSSTSQNNEELTPTVLLKLKLKLKLALELVVELGLVCCVIEEGGEERIAILTILLLTLVPRLPSNDEEVSGNAFTR